jgi:predicted membrane channel-forming protein YqfA (hemolysin III family)
MPDTDYLKFGFQSTIGSFAAMAIPGIIALIGILMVLKSKNKETGERNNALFYIGIVLVVLAALPALPYFGLSFLLDQD